MLVHPKLGTTVIRPDTLRPLAAAGANVPDTDWCLRRLKDGDVLPGLLGAAPAPGQVATAFSVALPGAGTVGTAVTLTLTPTGGSWPAGVTLTPAVAGVTGTFSPATLAPSGTAAVTATFSPASAGTGTVTVGSSPAMAAAPAGGAAIQVGAAGTTPTPTPAPAGGLVIGTTAGTAAAGNDPRIVGAALASSLAVVATSGSYTDLLNKPVIPAAPATATVPGLPAATLVDSLMVAVFQSDNTAFQTTVGALKTYFGAAGTAGVPTLTLTMPTGVQPGASYPVSGTYANDGTSPVLAVSVDGGAFAALPSGSTVAGGAISLMMPGVAAGSHTVQVRDGNGVLSNVVTFSAVAPETLTVGAIGAQVAGAAFTIPGTYANGLPASLDYSLDGGTSWTTASSPTISSGSYSIPGVVVAAANASQVVRVRDHGAQSVVGTSAAFAVSAAPSGTTITFAGAAGVPAGNQVLTAYDNGTLSNYGLDGSGSLLLPDQAFQYGLFDGIGPQPDLPVTATFGTGSGKSVALFFRATRGATAAANRHYAVFFDGGQANVFKTTAGGSGATPVMTFNGVNPTSSVGVVPSGSSFAVQADGVTVGTFTDATIPAGGLVGIGTANSVATRAKISQFKVG